MSERVLHIINKTNYAKRKVLEMSVRAGMGHITTAYSCAEIIAVLYYAIMRHDPQKPDWSERDRFILSKNHGSVMLYPILADLGFFPETELVTFMQDGTRLGGHSKLVLPGIDYAGGSLGIGLGVGAGMAYAAKMDRKDWLTFVLIGDGESYEGSIWEAAMFAAHNRLGNLITVLDRNRMCCTDFTESILSLEPLTSKWQSFGWDAIEVNGHSVVELLSCLENVHEIKREKPLVLIAQTTKGNGIEFMSNAPLYHGIAPCSDDIERAFMQLEEVEKA